MFIADYILRSKFRVQVFVQSVGVQAFVYLDPKNTGYITDLEKFAEAGFPICSNYSAHSCAYSAWGRFVMFMSFCYDIMLLYAATYAATCYMSISVCTCKCESLQTFQNQLEASLDCPLRQVAGMLTSLSGSKEEAQTQHGRNIRWICIHASMQCIHDL